MDLEDLQRELFLPISVWTDAEEEVIFFFFRINIAFFFNKCLFNLKSDGKTRNKKERKKKVDAYGIGLAAAKEEEPETEVGKPRAGEEKAQEG